jgi:hypothetical protein
MAGVPAALLAPDNPPTEFQSPQQQIARRDSAGRVQRRCMGPKADSGSEMEFVRQH